MFAVLELGGKQYLVREKDVLRIEKLETDAGKTVECTKVLLLAREKETKVGTPYIADAKALLKVRHSGLGEKVRIFKMKAKKRYRKLRGHRQPFTEVEVVKISG